MTVRMKPVYILICSLLLSWDSVAQRAPKIDSIHMVLLNPYIQLEAAQAINDMYNFKFAKSMLNLKHLKIDFAPNLSKHQLFRVYPGRNKNTYADKNKDDTAE